MIINTQIKKHRLEMNMSQDKLAEKMFISRQSISKWENGETLPSVENLIILSEILEIPLDELVKGKRSYPMPFYFGKPKNKIPIIMLLASPIFLFALAISERESPEVFLIFILLSILSFFLGLVISFFDFKRYYNYFILKENGIDVEFDRNAKRFKKTLNGILGRRKSLLIHYHEIKSLEMVFNNLGYTPKHSTSLNYRPRQMYIARESFYWILKTKSNEEFKLDLDRLFYPDSVERKYFSAICQDLASKDIIMIDQSGILEAIEKEYDLIEKAYEKQGFTKQL